MSISKLFFLSFIAFAVSACSHNTFLVHNGNMPPAEKIAQIKAGQSQQQVAAILGSPSSVTSFDPETWLYMSSTLKKVAFFAPKEVNREILAVHFDKNGIVTEVADYDETNGREIIIDKTVTPTAGHQIGFFKKYFGGVGAFLPISPSATQDNL